MQDFSRRRFLETATATAAATTLSSGVVLARSAAKYVRYDVESLEGKFMLDRLGQAVKNMLSLSPEDPRNWIRNAFIHNFDCPHGNWWFFPWHRGFTGWFEQICREASGDKNFAFPYWDWSTTPWVPNKMFDGVLTPTDEAYAPYTKDRATFENIFKPIIDKEWDGFTSAQKEQLGKRWKDREAMWDQVWNNPMYCETQDARYVKRDCPFLPGNIRGMCATENVCAGIKPTDFQVFGSGKADSHNAAPDRTRFGILEGQPHNNVHNYVGGAIGQKAPPPPYGYMQDNLSPVDPLFCLHHSQMDRIYEAWIRKQKARGLRPTPIGPDYDLWAREPFLFYIGPDGRPVTKDRCGDYAEIGAFDYEYNEPHPYVCPDARGKKRAMLMSALQAKIDTNGVATLAMPPANADTDDLVAEVTIPHPDSARAPRTFDILINAPAGTTSVDVDSPYYGGTIAFFGYMPGMSMPATFRVPLKQSFKALKMSRALSAGGLNIQVVASTPAETPALRANLLGLSLKSE